MVDDDVLKRVTLVVRPAKMSEEILETYEIDVDAFKEMDYRHGRTGLQAEAITMLGMIRIESLVKKSSQLRLHPKWATAIIHTPAIAVKFFNYKYLDGLATAMKELPKLPQGHYVSLRILYNKPVSKQVFQLILP